MKTIIRKIEKIVEATCANDANVFGYSIWTHHIKLVAKVGREIAPEFQADAEIVEIAALLHDYASVKDEKLYKDHHIHSPIAAGHILNKLGYPEDKIEAVKHCIASHRASVPRERRTPEAECLANADAIVHIRNVPSLLNFVYMQRGMDIDAGAAWVRDKLKRTWKKLSPQMQEEMRVEYEASLLTLAEGKSHSE
ncbi:MAG: HD domain-containing protein [bacterium]